MAVSLRNLRILQIFAFGPIISFSDQEVIGLKILSLVSSNAVHWVKICFIVRVLLLQKWQTGGICIKIMLVTQSKIWKRFFPRNLVHFLNIVHWFNTSVYQHWNYAREAAKIIFWKNLFQILDWAIIDKTRETNKFPLHCSCAVAHIPIKK